MVTGQFCVWTGPRRRRRASGWLLTLNIICSVMFPVETFATAPTMNHDYSTYQQNQRPPQFQHILQSNWRDRQWPTGVSSISQTFPSPERPVNSFTVPNVAYLPSPKSGNRRFWRPNTKYGLKKKKSCDGRGNFLQDLGVLAIVSGAVGTVMGIFSASYYSVVGNTISIISGILSYVTGIPSAIITYLAASDRLSYTIANVLSILSLANTAYSFWSVDFGNKDIFTSQVANVIGVFSLVLSVITAFPEVFDTLLYEFTSKDPVKRREVYRFLNNYGCSGDNPTTFYDLTQDLIREFTKDL